MAQRLVGQGRMGLVFELKKPSGSVQPWKETVLHAFSGGNDGAGPVACVTFDRKGSLYGTKEFSPPSTSPPRGTLSG